MSMQVCSVEYRRKAFVTKRVVLKRKQNGQITDQGQRKNERAFLFNSMTKQIN